MRRRARNKPLQFRISGSELVPRVLRSVLATSRGFVAAAAMAPAAPPAMMCVVASYSRDAIGLRAFLKYSYEANCTDWNGIVIVRVVGYDT